MLRANSVCLEPTWRSDVRKQVFFSDGPVRDSACSGFSPRLSSDAAMHRQIQVACALGWGFGSVRLLSGHAPGVSFGITFICMVETQNWVIAKSKGFGNYDGTCRLSQGRSSLKQATSQKMWCQTYDDGSQSAHFVLRLHAYERRTSDLLGTHADFCRPRCACVHYCANPLRRDFTSHWSPKPS